VGINDAVYDISVKNQISFDGVCSIGKEYVGIVYITIDKLLNWLKNTYPNLFNSLKSMYIYFSKS